MADKGINYLFQMILLVKDSHPMEKNNDNIRIQFIVMIVLRYTYISFILKLIGVGTILSWGGGGTYVTF